MIFFYFAFPSSTKLRSVVVSETWLGWFKQTPIWDGAHSLREKGKALPLFCRAALTELTGKVGSGSLQCGHRDQDMPVCLLDRSSPWRPSHNASALPISMEAPCHHNKWEGIKTSAPLGTPTFQHNLPLLGRASTKALTRPNVHVLSAIRPNPMGTDFQPQMSVPLCLELQQGGADPAIP